MGGGFFGRGRSEHECHSLPYSSSVCRGVSRSCRLAPSVGRARLSEHLIKTWYIISTSLCADFFPFPNGYDTVSQHDSVWRLTSLLQFLGPSCTMVLSRTSPPLRTHMSCKWDWYDEVILHFFGFHYSHSIPPLLICTSMEQLVASSLLFRFVPLPSSHWPSVDQIHHTLKRLHLHQ